MSVMYTPSSGQIYHEPHIYINGERLEVVDKFVYLGRTFFWSSEKTCVV